MTQNRTAMLRTFLSIVLATSALAGPHAHAATPTAPLVVIEAYHYMPGDVHLSFDLTITQGQTLQVVNIDPVGGFHTVTAEDTDTQGYPIFDSGAQPVAPGSAANVEGTDKLIAGRSYAFYCSVHGANVMEGRVTVVS